MMTPSSKTPVRNLQHPPSMTSRMGGSWGTSKHARELKFGTQVKNHISRQNILSMVTPSSKTPVRNLQDPPSMTSRTGGSWGTFKHVRELKFGTQVKNHISGWFIALRMIPSSKTPVRNLQRPPSMTLRMGGSWGTSKHARELIFGTQVKNHISRRTILWMMTQSSKTPVRNLQRPPSMTSRMGGSWGTSKHDRELKFGTQVKKHISRLYILLMMTQSSKTPVRNLQHLPSMTARMGGFLRHF